MDICVICTDNLNTIDTIMTKCNHKFHFECLNKWLLIKPRCPCCREDIFDLIDPRTNERIVYFNEYDENYEYGRQPIIPIIPNISITFLVYYYVFLKLFTNHLSNYIYFYNSSSTLNSNSFIILIVMRLIITIYIFNIVYPLH